MRRLFLHPQRSKGLRRTLCAGCSVVALLLAPSHAVAQERVASSSSHWVSTAAVSSDSIVGLVVEAEKGKPIDGAAVSVEGSHVGTLTDSAGRFGLDVSNLTETEFVINFAWIGYEQLRANVERQADAGIAIQASLKKAEITRCGLVLCMGGYHCEGGVKVVVHGMLDEIPDGTPVTLIATSGLVADTAVARAGDQREIYLAAGEDLGVDGPFSVHVSAPGYAPWETSGVWLYSDPCSDKRASPWVRVWLLPPTVGDSLSNKR